MLSLYRAWLGPSPCVARPAPPPGAHRPVPRRARAPSPPPPPSPRSSASSDLDVERVEPPDPPLRPEARPGPGPGGGAVLDVASCDGPVRFSRVLNAAWRGRAGSPPPGWARRPARRPPPPRAAPQYYPCKTCGSKFPSYYFVHKHRKRCHAADTADTHAAVNLSATGRADSPEPEPTPSTSRAAPV